MTKRKVFGIGLPKTGTTSLHTALHRLGYKVGLCEDIFKVIELSTKVDAITDGLTVPYVEALDRLYPDAQFILTLRDEKEWLDSCRRYYARIKVETLSKRQRWGRRVLWGMEEYDERIFHEVYHKTIWHTYEYFSSRPEKLLELFVCAGEGYELLCPFLGVPAISEPFPHENRGAR